MHVNVHEMDWVAAQENPMHKFVMEWISTHKVQDLKHLLGDHATTEEGMAIWPYGIEEIHTPPRCPISLPYSC